MGLNTNYITKTTNPGSLRQHFKFVACIYCLHPIIVLQPPKKKRFNTQHPFIRMFYRSFKMKHFYVIKIRGTAKLYLIQSVLIVSAFI